MLLKIEECIEIILMVQSGCDGLEVLWAKREKWTSMNIH